ncbi:MAG: 30S ribosomal protein S2 [Candidatus Kaiserbacteria bacterium]|nr:30S ribosomal protein S2 [Candidatus Kaiserbacteria bacterium]
MANNKDIAQEIERVGGHYAVTNRYRHPSLGSMIEGKKGNQAVFSLEKVTDLLEKTLAFVEECGKKGHIILFVATRQETVDLVKQTAENLSLPYMLNRWIGGTLSNFTNIKGRINKMSTMQKEKEEGAWTKYTKKEKVLLNRELAKLENRFTGIAALTELPKAIFILDTRKESIAVKEANGAKVPVIGFSTANADIHRIQHPIIANIHSRQAVTYILSLVEEAYKKGASNKEKEVPPADSKKTDGGNSGMSQEKAGTIPTKQV